MTGISPFFAEKKFFPKCWPYELRRKNFVLLTDRFLCCLARRPIIGFT